MNWKVIHGDCKDVLPMLERADAIVTDPPYGIGADPATRRPSKWQRGKGASARQWDNEAPSVAPLLALAPVVAIWGGNYFQLPAARGWVVWCKPDAPPSMGSVEMCWTNLDRTARHIVYSIAATNGERCGHPTQKPLAVMAFTLAWLRLAPGSLILDPYCGSGTTGVAALNMGHRFIGIEREAEYVALAQRRIADAAAQSNLFSGVA